MNCKRREYIVKFSAVTILMAIFLIFSACGESGNIAANNSPVVSSEYTHTEEMYTKSPMEIPQENLHYPFLQQIEVTLLIDGHRSFISAYETHMYDVLVSVEDFSRKLEAARVSFDLPEYLTDSYMRIFDIAFHIDLDMQLFSINHHPDMIAVYTSPLTWGEEPKAAVTDFLMLQYPQLFMREMIFEDFGYGIGRWFAWDFWLMDINGAPIIVVTLMDAGSTSGVSYLYIDGDFRRADNAMRLFVDNAGNLIDLANSASNGIELTPARILRNMSAEITARANSQIWQTVMHPSGITADSNLSDETINLAISFLENFVQDTTYNEEPFFQDFRINEIKYSLIRENLLRIQATFRTEFADHEVTDWHWLKLTSDLDDIKHHFIGHYWHDSMVSQGE